MGCFVWGDKNSMGCFVQGGKSLWDVLPRVSKMAWDVLSRDVLSGSPNIRMHKLHIKINYFAKCCAETLACWNDCAI